MKNFLLISLILTAVGILAGCAPTRFDWRWEPTVAPDGRHAWTIECSHKTYCYEQAGRLCISGYDNVLQDTAFLQSTDANRLEYRSRTQQEYTMLIVCR